MAITVPNALIAGQLVTDVDLATYRQAILDLTAAQAAPSTTTTTTPTPTPTAPPAIFQAMDQSSSGGNSQTTGWTTLYFSSLDYSQGSTISYGNAGPYISVTGRYVVSTLVVWASNSTGLRGIGFGPNTNTSPGSNQIVGPPSASNITSCSLTQEMGISAGTTLTLFGYQSSGGNLTASFRRMCVRQVA